MAKRIRIIGIPIDLGQQHRGVDMGPIAIRYAGLRRTLKGLGYETEDGGNIAIPGHYTLKGSTFEERLPLISNGCQHAYLSAQKAIEDGTTPIFLGGDHSASIGSIGGITDREPCGLLWVDAHGDFNTPQTSETGNVHGMALAILLGRGPSTLVDIGRPGPKLNPRHVVLVGIRNLDPRERESLRESGCTVFTMRDIDEIGMSAVLKKSLAVLKNCQRIHLSLDMDSIDPNEAPGVGTPVPGGLNYREAQLLMEIIHDTDKLCSMDIMETNPILDHCNRTAQIAVSLTASLFGKQII